MIKTIIYGTLLILLLLMFAAMIGVALMDDTDICEGCEYEGECKGECKYMSEDKDFNKWANDPRWP